MSDEALYLYGVSDDLIEVRGATIEECDPPYGKPATIIVEARTDTGVVDVRVRAWYDAARTDEWRFTELDGHGLVTITPARGEDAGNDADGCPGYSDKVTVRGGIWARLESGSNG
jgi:hypothetical protein